MNGPLNKVHNYRCSTPSNKYLLLMVPVRLTWQKSLESAGAIQYTVDLVIFACFNFHEFPF